MGLTKHVDVKPCCDYNKNWKRNEQSCEGVLEKKPTKKRVNVSSYVILKCFGAKDLFKKDDV